jgi:Mg-chelatase subunit ChlD
MRPIRSARCVRLGLLLLVLGICPLAAEPTQESFDYLFVIDTSGSMVGKPAGSGNAVIFPQVKEALCSFIQSIESGATLAFLPFHRDVQARKEIVLSDASRAAACDYVKSLDATGQVTWVYYSLRTALKRAEELRQGASGPRVQTILLYTDGKDNGPQDLTLEGILQHFKLQRAENEHLYLRARE